MLPISDHSPARRHPARLGISLLAAALAALVLPGCVPISATLPGPGPGPGPAAAGPSSRLSDAQLEAVGRAVWRNECGGTVAGLTTWNAGEGFLSLGIGHFIWFPQNYQGQRFTESFPGLAAFLTQRGNPPPAWVRPGMPCPWPTRAAFEADRNGPRATELRRWLAATVADQAAFIGRRLDAALPRMLAVAPAADRQRISRNFSALAQTPEGLFALIDYVNFKGEGINPDERYNGQGWGLLQVLQGMNQPTIAAFSRSADQVLTRRVANAPADRGERRWLEGWRNRVGRYGSSL